MPPRRRNNRRRAGKQRATAPLVQQMSELNIAQRAQQLKVLPMTPDPRSLVIKDKIVNFTEKVALGPITASTNAATLGTFQFTLSQAQNYGAITSLYDAYRIAQISVQFAPRLQMGPTTSSLLTVVDLDDAAVPLTIQALYGYKNCMVSPAGVLVERVFSPRITLQVYQGAVTSYARAPWSTWVDANNPSVPYYGLKYGLNPVGAAPGAPQYDAYATLVIQCRNQRG